MAYEMKPDSFQFTFKPENIGQGTKVFSYYFVTDNTQDFDWGMLRTIIHQGFLQASFINYFNQP
jgi:hypothetical protein